MRSYPEPHHHVLCCWRALADCGDVALQETSHSLNLKHFTEHQKLSRALHQALLVSLRFSDQPPSTSLVRPTSSKAGNRSEVPPRSLQEWKQCTEPYSNTKPKQWAVTPASFLRVKSFAISAILPPETRSPQNNINQTCNRFDRYKIGRAHV